jgi:sulfite exporter TauE/SafE/copper chaperone CopZ
MNEKLSSKVLKISGMTCTSCERRIENRLKEIEGIKEAQAVYSSSELFVTYNSDVIELERIIEAVNELDYEVVIGPQIKEKSDKPEKSIVEDKFSIDQILGIGVTIIAGYIILKNTIGFNFIPQVNQNMGYGILFVVGFMTSLHCIAMCGGINLSQCVVCKVEKEEGNNLSKLTPSFLYNGGRVISYTIIGGIVGAIGSLVSFSGTTKGIVAIVAGIFMVIMGLNMLNIFPWLRKINPRMPKFLGNKIQKNSGKRGPFIVGILNGLMPCGPLQAMQIYALGTGSFLGGAASMFFFSIGTVPLMFGFGAMSSLISRKFNQKMIRASAILVIVLGMMMAGRGFNLSGVNLAFANSGTGSIAKIENGVQLVTTEMKSGNYAPIVVEKGIPVKWTIKADESELNGCNNPVTIPKYNIVKKLVPGDNVIEFTPEEEGNITYTCWMGMISSNIKVVDNISNVNIDDVTNEKLDYLPTRGGCCGVR